MSPREYIMRSPLLWASSALLLVSCVFSAISIATIFSPDGIKNITDAVENSGINSGSSINSYIAIHIIICVMAFIVPAVYSVSIFSLLLPYATSGGNKLNTSGVSLIDWLNHALHIACKVAVVALSALFAFRIVMFLYACYKSRYSNGMVYSALAVIFGEAVLALITAGLIFWVYKLSYAWVDDVAAIKSYVVSDQPAGWLSRFVCYSTLAMAAVSAVGAVYQRYQLSSAVALGLICIACVAGWIFLRQLAVKSEEWVYERKMNKSDTAA